MEKNILDDIFNTPEEQVETFMEVIKPLVTDPNSFSRVTGGQPDQISAPSLVDQVSGWIRIQHGWHGEDYVWHISAHHTKKPFKVSIDRVVYAIAKVMNDVIPQTVEVKIWLPMQDWEIQEITFKAVDLASSWNVSEESINKLNLKLFEVLGTLV
ncbi:MAG: hypothetical protein EBZ49_00520 [Proteobacteria bacterium]|nr:hypothetical protein [Pseudomonadota bacterium]